MNQAIKLLYILLFGTVVFGLIGCDESEDVVDETGDAIEETVEETSKAVGDAAEETADKVEDAADKMD